MKKLFFAVLFLCLLIPILSQAQSDQNQVIFDKQTIVKARVIEILKSEVKSLPGTKLDHENQTIKVRILEGAEKDAEVVVENDYLILKAGEKFYLKITESAFDGHKYYLVDEPYRLPQLTWLLLIFLVVVLAFGGIQGIRGLISLVGSFILIIYVLLPGILSGFSPLLVTVVVSSLIIIIGSYITHGFNKTTTVAVAGMISTVIITGLLAYWAVHFTRMTGLSSDEVIYLNFDTGGIDVVGLLLGGIMIGLLGVLYDAAISQAIFVEELSRIAPHVGRRSIYRRAIRVGREHIGALVDTLAIAYVGVSLPLLLLFYQSSTESVWVTLNREIFSAEIVRTLVGSIGLILAIPVTTLIAVMILVKKNTDNISEDKIIDEEKKMGLAGHGHSHGHNH